MIWARNSEQQREVNSSREMHQLSPDWQEMQCWKSKDFCFYHLKNIILNLYHAPSCHVKIILLGYKYKKNLTNLKVGTKLGFLLHFENFITMSYNLSNISKMT